VCDGSFKIMKYSFIQNGLNMMILYVSNRSKLISVSISVGPLNSVGKDKIDLLLDDLMKMINYAILDNFFIFFIEQRRFNYFQPNNNKDNIDIKLITNPQVWRQGKNKLFLGKCHINPNVEFKR